jgi:uncharacterized small protein (DUF1192 family)
MSDNTNTGHGWVRSRPDGVVMRCGGPALCSVCKQEAAELAKLDIVDRLKCATVKQLGVAATDAMHTAATTIASLRAENERLKACQDICRVCGPDAKGCSHIQPRRLLLAEIDRLRTLLAAAQAECEAAGTLIETLADRGRKTLQAAAWKKYNAARRKVQGESAAQRKEGEK